MRVGPQSHESVLIRDREEHRETQRNPCEDKAEIEGMSPQAKEHQGVQAPLEAGRRPETGSPLGAPEGANPKNILILNFLPPKL